MKIFMRPCRKSCRIKQIMIRKIRNRKKPKRYVIRHKHINKFFVSYMGDDVNNVRDVAWRFDDLEHADILNSRVAASLINSICGKYNKTRGFLFDDPMRQTIQEQDLELVEVELITKIV